MSRILAVVAVTFLCCSAIPRTALALPVFKKAFQKKYVDESGNDGFAAAFKKSSCNTCHVKGEKKNVHNVYGVALSELIEGNAKQRLKDAKASGNADEVKAQVLSELDTAMDQVAKMKVSEEGAETYGDRIAAGELPVEAPPVDEDAEEE